MMRRTILMMSVVTCCVLGVLAGCGDDGGDPISHVEVSSCGTENFSDDIFVTVTNLGSDVADYEVTVGGFNESDQQIASDVVTTTGLAPNQSDRVRASGGNPLLEYSYCQVLDVNRSAR